MMPIEYSVEGKTVIITGAARGIGKGITRVLSEMGAKVMVTALTDRYLDSLAKEMSDLCHPIDTVVADATKQEDWQRTVDLALSLWGRIDVLINNLGDAISKPLVPLEQTSTQGPITDQEWRSVIDVNLTEAFMGCRAVGSHFLERRCGKVINISGVAARRGTPGLAAYSAAKAAVVRLTQALASEWAPYGITVNAIAPGNFPDPENMNPEELNLDKEQAKTSIPIGRVGDLREVGLLALYLASDASNYMTGETIYLDGGLSSC